MEDLEKAAPLLRAASHPVRLRIIDFLRRGEANVGEISAATGIGQAGTSQQLAILRQNGIVAARREGQNVYYHVVFLEMNALLDCIRDHCRLGNTR